MDVELKEYVERLVWECGFAECLDIEVRRDKVLWVLEQEFPDVTSRERLFAVWHVLPVGMEVMDEII